MGAGVATVRKDRKSTGDIFAGKGNAGGSENALRFAREGVAHFRRSGLGWPSRSDSDPNR
jgi:hypothetical protein